jgi:ribosomal protein S18 acetylase RimI-like enzyme
MITVELISPRNAMLFKDIRLRALQETPSAFGSTYARESQLTDADWVKRAAQWTSDKSCGYLAMEGGIPCGIAAGLLDQSNATQAELMSMWVGPSHRRMAVGGSLVVAICAWARTQKVRTLRLMVTGNNDPAIRFYQRLGFALTGRTVPYPNDADLIEHEMSQTITHGE